MITVEYSPRVRGIAAVLAGNRGLSFSEDVFRIIIAELGRVSRKKISRLYKSELVKEFGSVCVNRRLSPTGGPIYISVGVLLNFLLGIIYRVLWPGILPCEKDAGYEREEKNTHVL